jgi:hypothetical protein
MLLQGHMLSTKILYSRGKLSTDEDREVSKVAIQILPLELDGKFCVIYVGFYIKRLLQFS